MRKFIEQTTPWKAIARLCLFLFVLVSGDGAASIMVEKGVERINLIGSDVRYVILPANVDRDKVLGGQFDSRMKPLNRNGFGYMDKTIWLKFELQNAASENLPLSFAFAYPLLDYIRVYSRSSLGGDWVAVEMGDRIVSNTGSSESANVHDFTLFSGERLEFYVQIESGSSLQISASIYERHAQQLEYTLYVSMYSLFIGAFLALGFYNLFLFILTGFWHYLTYSLLALSSVLREAYLSGLQYQLILHAYPLVSEGLGIINLVLNICLVNFFVMGFLKVKESSRGSYYFLVVASIICFSYIPLWMIKGYSPAIKLFTVQVMVTSISCVVISFIRYRQGFSIAKHFIAAFWFALGGYLITAVASMGVVDSTLSSRLASAAGQFIEMVVLSFALSAYINQIKREKNAAVLELNRVLQAAVKEKTEDIRIIMNHIPEGICLVRGPEAQISGDYSKYLEEIVLRSDLDGQKFMDLVFRNSSLDANTIDQVRNCLRSILGEPSWTFDVNGHLLVSEFERLNAKGQSEIYTIAWHPIINEQDVIEEVLVVLKNETNLRAVQEEARQKNQQLKILDELLHIQEDRFESFALTCQTLLDDLNAFIQRTDFDVGERKRVARSLHTFKGVARSLNLSELANAIHETEDVLGQASALDRKDLLKAGQSIETVLQRYLEFSRRKLGRNLRPAATDERIRLIDSCLGQLAQVQNAIEPRPLKTKIEWISHRLLEAVGHRLKMC